jgi:hypothetical protein
MGCGQRLAEDAFAAYGWKSACSDFVIPPIRFHVDTFPHKHWLGGIRQKLLAGGWEQIFHTKEYQ